MSVTLAVRWQGKTHRLSLAATVTAQELQAAIEQHCGVSQSRQELRGGFPPKPLDLSSPSASLTDLGLRDRDSLTLQEAQEPLPPDCPPRPKLLCKPLEPDTVGDLERRVIPADNSCLFNSVLQPLQLELGPMSLRQAVSAHIRADSAELDAHCLAEAGKDSLAYAEWIIKPDSWGGFVDLHILSGYLRVQICAICIRTLRVESFPSEPPQAGGPRIFVLFDGIHYDCIVAAGGAGGVFSSKDDSTLGKALTVAMELQEKKQFTDTANFTLQCQHCFKLLTGEADAQKHAKETGHFNFQEAPKP